MVSFERDYVTIRTIQIGRSSSFEGLENETVDALIKMRSGSLS